MTQPLASDNDLLIVRKARKKFIAMAATYSLSIFNDNFFKQAALLLAVNAGMNDAQGMATVLFTLPYLFLTSIAGWLADRFTKRNVVIAVKLLELVAMTAGALGMICLKTGNSLHSLSWILILTMVALMGAHASLFSPALNGTIPEIYPRSYVNRANGIIKMVSTLGILTGIASAGFVLDFTGNFILTDYLHEHNQTPKGQALLAILVLFTSLLGLVVSLGVPAVQSLKTRTPFPWSGPLKTFSHLREISQDAILNLCVWGNTFFWFAGALIVLIVNELGTKELGLNNTLTSVLGVGEMMGVGAGALLSSYFSKGQYWYRLLWKMLSGMGLCLLLCSCVSFFDPPANEGFSVSFLFVFFCLTSAGIFGGLFLIPIESFIQIRPSADSKGKVIAAGNFVAMGGVLLSGGFYWALSFLHLLPSSQFLILSLITLAGALLLNIVFSRYEQQTLILEGNSALSL